MCRTVTDLGSSSNMVGFSIAVLSVLSSTMQQIFCRTMQQRNGLGFLEFLSHTSAAQVAFADSCSRTARSCFQSRLLDVWMYSCCIKDTSRITFHGWTA